MGDPKGVPTCCSHVYGASAQQPNLLRQAKQLGVGACLHACVLPASLAAIIPSNAKYMISTLVPPFIPVAGAAPARESP